MKVYHASTLKPELINNIYSILSKSQFQYSDHALDQKEKKQVANWEYIVKNGKLIEFKFDDESHFNHRALLRTPDGNCAVFGLKSKMVITMWWNNPNDNHKTIDASKYETGVKFLI